MKRRCRTGLTDAELDAAATAPDPALGNPAVLPLGFRRPTAGGAAPAGGRGRAAGAGGRGGANPRAFRSQLNKFLKDEGVLVVLTPGNGPDGGTIMGQAAGSQNAERSAAAAFGGDHQRALQPHRAPAGEEHSGDAGIRYRREVHRTGRLLQPGGGDSRAPIRTPASSCWAATSIRGPAAPAPPTTRPARPSPWKRCAF